MLFQKASLLSGVDVPMKNYILSSSLVIMCKANHNCWLLLYATLSSQLLHKPNLLMFGVPHLLPNLKMFLEHLIPVILDPGVLSHELVHGPNSWAIGLLGRTRGSGC